MNHNPYRSGAHISDTTVFNCTDAKWDEILKALGPGNYFIIPLNVRDTAKANKIRASYDEKLQALEQKHILESENLPNEELLAAEEKKDKKTAALIEKLEQELKKEESAKAAILASRVSLKRLSVWRFDVDEAGHSMQKSSVIDEVLKHNIVAVRGINRDTYASIAQNLIIDISAHIIRLSSEGEDSHIEYTMGELKKN